MHSGETPPVLATDDIEMPEISSSSVSQHAIAINTQSERQTLLPNVNSMRYRFFRSVDENPMQTMAFGISCVCVFLLLLIGAFAAMNILLDRNTKHTGLPKSMDLILTIIPAAIVLFCAIMVAFKGLRKCAEQIESSRIESSRRMESVRDEQTESVVRRPGLRRGSDE